MSSRCHRVGRSVTISSIFTQKIQILGIRQVQNTTQGVPATEKTLPQHSKPQKIQGKENFPEFQLDHEELFPLIPTDRLFLPECASDNRTGFMFPWN